MKHPPQRTTSKKSSNAPRTGASTGSGSSKRFETDDPIPARPGAVAKLSQRIKAQSASTKAPHPLDVMLDALETVLPPVCRAGARRTALKADRAPQASPALLPVTHDKSKFSPMGDSSSKRFETDDPIPATPDAAERLANAVKARALTAAVEPIDSVQRRLGELVKRGKP